MNTTAPPTCVCLSLYALLRKRCRVALCGEGGGERGGRCRRRQERREEEAETKKRRVQKKTPDGRDEAEPNIIKSCGLSSNAQVNTLSQTQRGICEGFSLGVGICFGCI